MKPKMLILLLLSAMTLSACADIPPVKKPVPVEQQTVVPAPEDGWTAEELMSVTYFEGIELCYPMSVSDLGSGYMMNFSQTDYQGMTHCYISLDIDYSIVADVMLDRQTANISAYDEIRSISSSPENMSLNGMKRSCSAADVKNALGTPDRINEPNKFVSEYYYCDKETGRDLLCVYVDKDTKNVTEFEFFLQ